MKRTIQAFTLVFVLVTFTALSGDEFSRRPQNFPCVSKADSPLEIIRSYDLWDNTEIPWGIVKIADTLWISVLSETAAYICTLRQYNIPLETFTGITWDVTSVGFSWWMADMCWDSARGLIWELAVRGTNGLYAIDPTTGSVEDTILDPAGIWTAISQRGVGYDPEEDIFYIGGWNDDLIYKVKGPGWAVPGEIIESFPAYNCAGLGWDKTTGTVWFGTNDSIDYIIQMDVTTGEHICSLRVLWSDGYGMAGLEVEDDGTIWHVEMNKKTVYHITNPMMATERHTPSAFSLSAYPNPFNSACRIEIESGEFRVESVEIFDLNGRLVAELPRLASLGTPSQAKGNSPLFKEGWPKAGVFLSGDAGVAITTHEFTWQPDETVTSGVYLVRAGIDGKTVSRKVVLLK